MAEGSVSSVWTITYPPLVVAWNLPLGNFCLNQCLVGSARGTQTDLERGDTIPITCYLLHLVESQIGIQALLATDRSARKRYIARKDVPITCYCGPGPTPCEGHHTASTQVIPPSPDVRARTSRVGHLGSSRCRFYGRASSLRDSFSTSTSDGTAWKSTAFIGSGSSIDRCITRSRGRRSWSGTCGGRSICKVFAPYWIKVQSRQRTNVASGRHPGGRGNIQEGGSVSA